VTRAARAFGFLGLLGAGLERLHVHRRLAEDVFGFVAHLGRVSRRSRRPDAARKRFPLHKNGFHVRENEIRQAHSD
jgi:hypothetical protein